MTTNNSFFASIAAAAQTNITNLINRRTIKMAFEGIGQKSVDYTIRKGDRKGEIVTFQGYTFCKVATDLNPIDTDGWTMANHDSKRPRISWMADTEIMGIFGAAEALALTWDAAIDENGNVIPWLFVKRNLMGTGGETVALVHQGSLNGLSTLPAFSLSTKSGSYYRFNEIALPEVKYFTKRGFSGEEYKAPADFVKIHATSLTSAEAISVVDLTDTLGMDMADLNWTIRYEIAVYNAMRLFAAGQKFSATVYMPEKTAHKGTEAEFEFTDYSLFKKSYFTGQVINELTAQEARKIKSSIIQGQQDYRRAEEAVIRNVKDGKTVVAYEPIKDESGDNIGAVRKLNSTNEPANDAAKLNDINWIQISEDNGATFQLHRTDEQINGKFNTLRIDTGKPHGRQGIEVINGNRLPLLRRQNYKLVRIAK